MRTKTIIAGLKNSQKFRFILTANSGEAVGMTLTVQQMADQFATTAARTAVWEALEKLTQNRQKAKLSGQNTPSGLVCEAPGFRHVQVDLF